MKKVNKKFDSLPNQIILKIRDLDLRKIDYQRTWVSKIFERYITIDDIEIVIRTGEIIREYNDDKPYPSLLLLGFINRRPLHIVIAKNETEKICSLVTAYFPDNTIWDSTFKNKHL